VPARNAVKTEKELTDRKRRVIVDIRQSKHSHNLRLLKLHLLFSRSLPAAGMRAHLVTACVHAPFLEHRLGLAKTHPMMSIGSSGSVGTLRRRHATPIPLDFS